jgi:hypothetical protein
MNYYDGSFYNFIIKGWKGIVNYLRTDAQKCKRVEGRHKRSLNTEASPPCVRAV